MSVLCRVLELRRVRLLPPLCSPTGEIEQQSNNEEDDDDTIYNERESSVKLPRMISARSAGQNPVIRALLQSKISEKPIIGARTARRDIPISSRIASLLKEPTWSVRSLLPDPSAIPSKEDAITKELLHHLLRLSALLPPKNEKEETKLLNSLQAQIQFVKEIQKVDTTGVEPLRAIRDESTYATEEETITLQDLQLYLEQEEKVGRNGKVRRKANINDQGGEGAHTWNPFGMSADQSKKRGKHFVVMRPKKASS